MKKHFNIHLVQPKIFWESPKRNMELAARMLDQTNRTADLVIFPEAFTTGFTMNANYLRHYDHRPAVEFFGRYAQELRMQILVGLFAHENGRLFNRLYWFRPDGTHVYYNKRHLFSVVGEDKLFTPGSDPMTVEWEGMRFRLNICYDLRFPVWSANAWNPETDALDYDVLIYVANWPEKRKDAYLPLLRARAIENQAYVIWVNRVGRDKNHVLHSGDSRIIGPDGHVEYTVKSHQERLGFHTLEREKLDRYREQFPVYRDWDVRVY